PARPRPRRSPSRERWPEPAATQRATGTRSSGPAAEAGGYVTVGLFETPTTLAATRTWQGWPLAARRARDVQTDRIRPLTFPLRQPIRSDHDQLKGSCAMGKRQMQSPMSAADKREQWGEF